MMALRGESFLFLAVLHGAIRAADEVRATLLEGDGWRLGFLVLGSGLRRASR